MLRERASALIIRNGQLLAIRRFTPEKGEYYVVPGGGVEADETPQQAAERELMEEGGVVVRATAIMKTEEFPDIGSRVHFVACELAEGSEPTWQEAQKVTADSTYRFVWLPVDRLEEYDLRPGEAKGLIASLS